MNCQICKIEIIEGNLVEFQNFKKLPQGIKPYIDHVVTCDSCLQKVQHLIRYSRVIEGEIIKPEELNEYSTNS